MVPAKTKLPVALTARTAVELSTGGVAVAGVDDSDGWAVVEDSCALDDDDDEAEAEVEAVDVDAVPLATVVEPEDPAPNSEPT